VCVSEPLPLRVEVDRESELVTGLVSSADGPTRPFTGWTELFTALQEAIADDRQRRATGTVR
jgi:hypothetical protein